MMRKLKFCFLILAGYLLFPAEGFSQIKINTSLSNPSLTRAQTAEVKIPMPQEIKAEDIIDSAGLGLNYDFNQSFYYLEKKEVKLAPAEAAVFTVEVKNVWNLPPQEITFIKEYTQGLGSLLEGFPEEQSAKSIEEKIRHNLDRIVEGQSQQHEGINEYRKIYKKNLQILESINRDVSLLEGIVLEAGLFPKDFRKKSEFLNNLDKDEFLAQDDLEVIEFNFQIDNPSSEKNADFIFTFYLPKEVNSKDVVDKQDLELKFDLAESKYYLYKKIDFSPQEKKSYKIKLRNIWKIDINKLESGVTNYIQKIMDAFEDSGSHSASVLLRQRIANCLGGIVFSQQESLKGARWIGAYRDNLKRIAEVKEDVTKLEKLALQKKVMAEQTAAQAEKIETEMKTKPEIKKTPDAGEKKKDYLDIIRGAIFGKNQPNRQGIWRIIWIIIVFLGIVSILFFLVQYFQQKTVVVDDLTGGFNRSYGMNVLSQELRRAGQDSKECSVIMIDLDHFKSINDRHGHLAGDVVLRNTAGTIKRLLEKKGVFVRHGGEEFFIILKDMNKEEAVSLAQKIRLEFEEKGVKWEKKTAPLTLSMGVATFPQDAKEVQDLMKACDDALYRAKQKGRNRVEPA